MNFNDILWIKTEFMYDEKIWEYLKKPRKLNFLTLLF